MMRPSTVCVLLSLFPALPAQVVRTVDAAGTTPFPTIQSAIDASTDDADVVLVRPGTYSDFVVADRGIAIVATGPGVEVVGTEGATTTCITRVPAGERVLLRGLSFAAPVQTVGPLLAVEDTLGVVVLEDLDVDARFSFPLFTLSQSAAIRIDAAADVLLVGSAVFGANGSTFGGQEFGSRALLCTASRVYAHGSSFTAGATTVGGGTGQCAIDATGGQIVLRDSTATGGPGGPGCGSSPFCGGLFPPGNGGTALAVGFGAMAWSIESSLEGGLGGLEQFGSGVGMPGPASTGPVTTQSAVPSTLATTPLVFDDDPAGTSAVFSVSSVPTSTVALFLDLQTTPAFLPGLSGFFAFGLGSIAVFGTTDSAGAYSLSIDISSFPPALTKLELTAQAVLLTGAGELEISNPSIVMLVDG